MHQDCSKTAFFDEWHFLSSECFLCVTLINKAAPWRARRGTRELCVCVRLRPCVYVCERGRERLVCVCVKELFFLNCQVWFGDSDLHTTSFNHTSCSAIYRFSSLTIYPFSFWAKRWAVFFFFFPGFLFCQTLNIKRVKSKKRNSLQWGVLPTKEWGGVRIQYESRCALLNLILLYIFFSRLKCHLQLRVSVSIFCSLCFCQTVVVELCTVTHSITNTKEHHCKFAYQHVLSTLVWWLCKNF